MRDIDAAPHRAHLSFRSVLTSPVRRAAVVFLVVTVAVRFLSSGAGPAAAADRVGIERRDGNAGGVLVIHVNDGLIYSGDSGGYSGQSGIVCEENYGDCENQPDCSSEISTLNPTMVSDDGYSRVFWVLAAFPTDSCPRVSGVTFGITYEENAFILEAWGHSGDFDISTLDWPEPGSGIAIVWAAFGESTPLRAELSEIAWFAGFPCASQGVFELVAHPIHGGNFADDSVPAILDPIEGYGALGFGGEQGSNPYYVRPVPVRGTSWGGIKRLWGDVR